MNAEELRVVTDLSAWIRERSLGAEGSHDYFHIQRVAAIAAELTAREAGSISGGTASSAKDGIDEFVVMLAAWLHDVADAKFHAGDEDIGPRTARTWLESQRSYGYSCLSERRIESVVFIIAHLSFRHVLQRMEKNGDGANGDRTNGNSQSHATANGAPEFERELESRGIAVEFGIVHDADKLDAIGAIGIARCFAFGGQKGRALYDPEDPPKEFATKAEYAASKGASLNHFYEKLFKLKDLMRTATGAEMARRRHVFMEDFVERFLKEWEGRS